MKDNAEMRLIDFFNLLVIYRKLPKTIMERCSKTIFCFSEDLGLYIKEDQKKDETLMEFLESRYNYPELLNVRIVILDDFEYEKIPLKIEKEERRCAYAY